MTCFTLFASSRPVDRIRKWRRAGNRSMLWAILAGILSWRYVVYFALTRTKKLQSPRARAYSHRRR
jgi:hypothetical protein